MSTAKQTAPNIRLARSNDIEAILALDAKFSVGKGILGHADINALDPGGPTDMSLVAEAGHEIAGFILAHVLYLMIPFTRVCVIQGMVVDPGYQRHGIGGKLLEELIEHCKHAHIQVIRALAPQDDTDLRTFLRSKGFAPSSILNYDRTIERA